MGKRIYSIIILILCCICTSAQSTSNDRINKYTYIYSIKDKDTLRLDRYDLPTYGTTPKPCVIFIFGGGFMAGNRDNKYQISYFKELAQNGYSVISIDYRLGLKKAKERAEQRAKEETENSTSKAKSSKKDFLTIFQGSIDMAVEDMFDATSYIVEHAKEWNIDETKIIANGSSAGAITALHGAYYISMQTELSKRLPENFRYAGIISFAGAIFSTKGDMKWEKTPPPMLFFHGDADSNVPYDQLRLKIFGIKTPYGFFGSKHIAKQMDKIKNPYYFYGIENATHEIANRPMKENINEVLTFLEKFVKQEQKLIINTTVQQPGKPTLNKKFGMKDYLRANGLIPTE